jgi:hypothetical protein
MIEEQKNAMQAIAERKPGCSKLIYDKTKRTIVSVQRREKKMENKRFHYEAEESDANARVTVERLTIAGPCFICPYDKLHCDPYCLCSVPPKVVYRRDTYYSYGYQCNNHAFIGEV